MIVTFKIITLDKRFHGHQAYKYAINCIVPSPLKTSIKNFCLYRNWLWETYGPANELNAMHHLHTSFQDYSAWAWKYETGTGNSTLKLFIKDDAILSNFLLKFS